MLFFMNHPSSTDIYTLSLHDALPISARECRCHHRSISRTCNRPEAIGRSNAGASLSRTANGSSSSRLRPDTECCRRSEEHTSELQSLRHLVCRLLLEKKKKNKINET